LSMTRGGAVSRLASAGEAVEARRLGWASARPGLRSPLRTWCSHLVQGPWTEGLAAFDAKTGARLRAGALIAYDEPFVSAPDGSAQLVRASDGAAIRFATVLVGSRRQPVVYTDDGRFAGDPEALRKILYRASDGGAEGARDPLGASLSDTELAALERKGLLAEFLSAKTLSPQ
jgi:hypothetical protein